MGGGNSTTTTENKPWAAAMPYYNDLYSKAQAAMNATQGQSYQGQTLAGPTTTQQQGVQGLKDIAPFLSAGAGPLQNLALSQIRGDWLSPETNPYIGQVANAAINPLQSALTKNLGSIRDRSISTGAYGGARQDLQENEALDQFTRASGDITSNIFAQNYANERGIQQNSGQLLDLANALGLAGPTALSAAGATEQGWNQAALDDQKMKFLEGLQSKWSGLGEFSNILNAGGFGTQTTTPPKQNPLVGILQGALGGGVAGAGLAQGIGGVAAGAGMGAFAPWMLPLALAGGLAGGLG